MALTVAELTVSELRELIADIVEEKLAELVRDPDEGLELRTEFVAEMVRRRDRITGGQPGIPLDEAIERLR